MKSSRSFTALSTIAVQAGQSQLVVSVLRSGSLVHLQLVQVQPGLCEIGSNQDENQTLIQEQLQLMDRLKKHESEVLAVVEQRRRRDEGTIEQKRNKKNKEEVNEAMVASLKEGWSLLLHLLNRRQEVLILASDFYHRALEFAVSIDRAEDRQFRADEAQLMYDSIRRDLLGKSLQVLSSSSILLQKLGQLQRVEALQRRGAVLQDEDAESSQCDGVEALRLEELVEALQDRRRRADQAVRLQLQRAENGIMVHKKEQESRCDDWTLILVQDLQSESTSAESADPQSDSTTKETKDLLPGSRSEQTRDLNFESRLDIESGSGSDQPPGSLLEPKSRSRQEEIRNLQSRLRLNVKAGSTSGSMSDYKSEETRHNQPESTSDVECESRADVQPDTGSDSKPESRSDQKSTFKLNMKSVSRSEETRNLKPESRSEENKDQQPESTSDIQSGSGSDLHHGSFLEPKSGSRPEEIRNLQSRFRIDLTSRSRSDLKSDSTSQETSDLQPESRLDEMQRSGSEQTRDAESGFRSDETQKLETGPRSDLKPESSSDLKPRCRSKTTRDLQSDCSSKETLDLQLESRSDLKPASSSDKIRNQVMSVETRNLEAGSRSVKLRSRLDFKTEYRSETKEQLSPRLENIIDLQSKLESNDLKPGSRLKEQLGSRSDLKPGSFSEAEASRMQDETKQFRPASTRSWQVEHHSQEDHAHQVLLTNQRQQLLSSWEHLVKVWSWVLSSSVLSNSSEAGRQLLKAEEALNTHMQLHTQAESACHDAENLKQILDQIRAPHTDPTSRQLSPLQALTEQLKRGGPGGRPSPPATDPTGSPGPEFTARFDVVLKELHSLKRKMESNLQLLQPYVTFLRAAEQVEEEMDELREIYRPEEEEEKEEEEDGGSDIRSPLKKKEKEHEDACWQEMLQRLLVAQKLGNNCVNTVTMVLGSGSDLLSVVSVVRQRVKQLNRSKQEVIKLRSRHQILLEQQEVATYCRKHQERLLKTLRDLNCVSELMDSCTLLDLGSNLQTSRLLERFSQARPHLTQLEAEVEYVMKSWETVRVVQDQVKEQDLSELLKLLDKVKNKVQQSESILNLTSSFHLTAKQLGALLRSDPAAGSGEAELSPHRKEQQLIQSLFTTAATLKEDICTAAAHCDWAGFRLQQLELRFLSLDSLCVLWLKEAARHEMRFPHKEELPQEERLPHKEELPQEERLTHKEELPQEERLPHKEGHEERHKELLPQEERQEERLCRKQLIDQLRDSFRELKKRFSNLKFLFLKRNDGTRNTKAVRNQLQQVELYDQKLQVLRKRLQGVTTWLGSGFKDGGVAREVEDVNELQRQMGELERRVREHQKTLDMICRLQKATEEYQYWCEEASATITRVRNFSSECRSIEVVVVLYRQFEKFVWPTVPQQEEMIRQISELAVRLHGAEEGRRYVQSTVSQHTAMVASIRELSDGLMKLEAKLTLEKLKQQQNNGEKEIKEEEVERRRPNEKQEEDEESENKLKENRKMKKMENRSSADACELKETGHTPELTAEHDGKAVPMKRPTVADRRPPLQKSRSQETDRETVTSESSRRQQSCSERFTSSFCSTQTFSLSCSPVDASPQDGSAGDLLEVELQQQEVMTEDSLSNDEDECASPDDISLPPLAETPESGLAQSDLEEDICFSSQSEEDDARSKQSGTGISTAAVQQQRVSSQTEGCLTPPTSLQSSTRFRSESISFVQSPLVVPTPSILTSTLYGILQTEETSIDNISQSADFIPGSKPVHESNTTDSCYNRDNYVDERRSSLETEQPQRSIGTQGSVTCNVPSNRETLPLTDPILYHAKLNQSSTHPKSSYCPQDKTPTQCINIFPQTIPVFQDISFQQPYTDTGLDQGINSSQSRKDVFRGSKTQRESLDSTSMVTGQNIHIQSSYSDTRSILTQASISKTLSKIHAIPQTRGFALSPSLTNSAVQKDNTLPQDIGLRQSWGTCFQTSTTLPQDSNLVPPSSQTSREPSSVDISQSRRLTTTTTVTQQTVYCQSSPSDSCYVPQAGSTLRSKQETSVSKGRAKLPDVHAPILLELNSVGNITLSSNNGFGSKQSHQTVYSQHESLTSSCTQPCVHDPGMTTASSQPEAQTQALAQQAYPHVTPPSSPPHLLTSDQAPDICYPMALREEIRLTPQIQGSLPAPPLPQTQSESLPQGKACKLGPSCFTRPLSRAIVMEGSPVAQEVEVTGYQEPTLTWPPQALRPCCLTSCHPDRSWLVGGDVSTARRGRALVCEDGKHFLFISAASDVDGGSHEARAAKPDNSQQTASDRWPVAEVLDTISVDWTWFGTLCVLLWLLYLILL